VALSVILACGGANEDVFIPKLEVSATGNDLFSPTQANALRGQTIRWTNHDTDNHTVQPDTNLPGMDSDSQYPNGIPPGSSFEYTVPNNAPIGARYYYHCRFHGTAGNGSDFGTGMVGVVEVVP
jgi:plastocyanin